MKRFLHILGILLAFAIGLGIGREQGKEQGKELARTEHAKGYEAGERIGYLSGVTDQEACHLYISGACERITRKSAR